MVRKRAVSGVFALAGAVAVIGAGNAQAATKTVFAGPAGTAHGVFGPNAAPEANAFSQKTVTIHVGDSVRWVINGFHTVTFRKAGGGDIPFLVTDPTAKYAGFNDALGAPFWFNGAKQLEASPLGGLPQGGKTFDGSKVTGSGIPQGATIPPYVLKFTKTGTFNYECVIHPGMDAKVKVVGRATPIPSAKADAAAQAKLLASEAKTAKALLKYTPPANTVTGGHDKGQIALLKFFPSTLHVAVGTAVKFQVTSKTEPHTFSFGPAAYLTKVAAGIVTPLPNAAGPPTLQFSPLVAFPSSMPPLPAYDGTGHGNGFFSTGTLGGDPHAPTTTTVTFSKAGTYNFICLVHPFMHGSIVVG
jgi:plastocyanin